MKIIHLFLIVFLLIACNTNKKIVKKQAEYNEKIAHYAKNTLDWQGTYWGMLPCEDCEGIQTEIVLSKNNTYEIASKYEGKSDQISIEKGTFRWSAEGNKITLYAANNSINYANYFIAENKIIKLENNGNRIQSEFSNMYILNKKGHDNRITEKYWQLIELNGIKVEHKSVVKNLYFQLKLKDSKVYGFGGCNRFSGHFELMDGNRIGFSKMLNTLIACKNAEQESNYLKVFETVDHYSILNDTLSMSKSRMAPMAKFKAIYMR